MSRWLTHAGDRRRGGRRPRPAVPVLAAVAAVGLVSGLVVVGTAAPAAAAGSFTQVTGFGANPGNLAMFSYLPSGLPSGAPLVVALHGCTQSATVYHADSGWPKFADQWGFAVVYPQQNSSNNIQDCFDWFTPANDSRGQGEAESVHEMVQFAESNYHVDPKRVYVTGLSAGGGFTSDLLADYPDVFAGGVIDSGLPTQCATSIVQTSSCQNSNQNKTPAQWGDLVRNSDPGHAGPWPRVAIWQGTADTTVAPVNATEERDQWTNVWGISQAASSTRSLPGGTTESIYNDGQGNPAVELYSISGMSHGLAVDPGPGATQCGTTAAFFLATICSSYYTALFWGLNNGSTPQPSTTEPTTTTQRTTTTTTPPPPARCFTDNNYNQTVAGRAHVSVGETFANGSNDAMGLWNTAVITSLREPTPGFFQVVPAC